MFQLYWYLINFSQKLHQQNMVYYYSTIVLQYAIKMENLKKMCISQKPCNFRKKIIAFFRIINYYTDMRIITDFFLFTFLLTSECPQSQNPWFVNDLHVLNKYITHFWVSKNSVFFSFVNPKMLTGSRNILTKVFDLNLLLLYYWQQTRRSKQGVACCWNCILCVFVVKGYFESSSTHSTPIILL